MYIDLSQDLIIFLFCRYIILLNAQLAFPQELSLTPVYNAVIPLSYNIYSCAGLLDVWFNLCRHFCKAIFLFDILEWILKKKKNCCIGYLSNAQFFKLKLHEWFIVCYNCYYTLRRFNFSSPAGFNKDMDLVDAGIQSLSHTDSAVTPQRARYKI